MKTLFATFAILTSLTFAPSAHATITYHRCSGLYTSSNGLALTKIQGRLVSCSTARKTTNTWGQVWAGEDVVRFTRVHRWRCVYTLVTGAQSSYGRVKCSAVGGRRVAFRVYS